MRSSEVIKFNFTNKIKRKKVSFSVSDCLLKGDGRIIDG